MTKTVKTMILLPRTRQRAPDLTPSVVAIESADENIAQMMKQAQEMQPRQKCKTS